METLRKDFVLESQWESKGMLMVELDLHGDDYAIYQCGTAVELYNHLKSMPEYQGCLPPLNYFYEGIGDLERSDIVDYIKQNTYQLVKIY